MRKDIIYQKIKSHIHLKSGKELIDFKTRRDHCDHLIYGVNNPKSNLFHVLLMACLSPAATPAVKSILPFTNRYNHCSASYSCSCVAGSSLSPSPSSTAASAYPHCQISQSKLLNITLLAAHFVGLECQQGLMARLQVMACHQKRLLVPDLV